MKLLFRQYLASLREREELDAILPDLLSEIGFTVYSRPQRGTTQAGVDIAAVGKDDDGERKLFLFSVKQGDLTRQSWDGTPQALRASLNDILDTYIPARIPKRYHDLKIVICLVFGGDIQEQVRSAVTGFIKKNTTGRISFDEWNGDKLAGLLLQGLLREEIMPKALRSYFQKAVAMVDEPDIAVNHFDQLVFELCKDVKNEKVRVRVVRQLYIALWVLFVWARDSENVEAPYRASEYVLLRMWDLLRPIIDNKKANASRKAITAILHYTIQLHLTIASELLERKILPHVGVRDGISIAVRTRTYVDVNLILFDILGRIGLTGLWAQWLIDQDADMTRQETAQNQIARLVAMGYQLINNNRVLFLPLQDQQAIDIAIFLIFANVASGNKKDTHAWLHEMAKRLALTVQTHGQYPCVFTEYRDLVIHPRAQTDDYRKEATSGSILIPLLAAFLSTYSDTDALDTLANLKNNELQHCTLQLWMPDESSEAELYLGTGHHGLALCDLPLGGAGNDLLRVIRDACHGSKVFEGLSAIATGYWPIVLTACRHYRLPVPPQFWIDAIYPQTDLPRQQSASA